MKKSTYVVYNISCSCIVYQACSCTFTHNEMNISTLEGVGTAGARGIERRGLLLICHRFAPADNGPSDPLCFSGFLLNTSSVPTNIIFLYRGKYLVHIPTVKKFVRNLSTRGLSGHEGVDLFIRSTVCTPTHEPYGPHTAAR